MSLKKQLILIFGALAFIAMIVVGITFWTFFQWRITSRNLQDHYQRNLLLEQIRVAMFRAFKEVPDAVTGDDPASREEFDAYIRPAEENFKKWAAIAYTSQEKKELRKVRTAIDSLVQAAHQAFHLVEAGRKAEASRFMENNLEDRNFDALQMVTEKVANAEKQRSVLLLTQVSKAQHQAQIVLIIAGIGAISLILLLSAYIFSDLFKPLREVEKALITAATGNLAYQLDEDRNDEFGKINRAFNHLVRVLEQKEKFFGVRSAGNETVPDAVNQPFNINLRYKVERVKDLVHTLLSELKNQNPNNLNQELHEELNSLLNLIEHGAALSFPLNLNPSRTDLRELLYEVAENFYSVFKTRGISMETELAANLDFIYADKLKLKEVVSGLVAIALKALPENGGKIGLRTRQQEETSVLIEVVGSPMGVNNEMDKSKLAEPTEFLDPGELELLTSILEQHCGSLKVTVNPEHGFYARIELPLIPIPE